ncbi:MAG TPA: serine hydrolase [Solirubrobacteraceae bacterium]|nr:serine hydrolase [Solirubrobacteraceae bacterium]
MRAIEQLFTAAGCRGWLCVRDVDGDGAAELDAGDLVASASVFKVAVGLEVARQIETGELDPAHRIRLTAGETTPGPTGFSRFEHDVEASVSDLLGAMMAISDNAATDALIDLVGVDAINATTRGLGLAQTVLPGPLRDLLADVAREVGYGSWTELSRASEPAGADRAALDLRIAESQGLAPAGGPRTTAAEMAQLLCLIWRDEAAAPAACARVRRAMAGQITRQRLASGFPRSVGVVAKSGSLGGVIRNEVGVVTRPDGRRLAAAVFTRAPAPGIGEREINAAIGGAAAAAIGHLAGCRSGYPR